MMQILIPDSILWENSLLHDHAIAFDERITRVFPVGSSADPALPGERLRGKILLPGMVNAHSHAFQRGLRGHVQWSPGTDSFWSWRERMYALANRLDPDGIGAVSSLAFLEMIRAGFTSVGEFHYLQHRPDGTPYENPDELALQVAAAARRAGIRIRLLRVAYARAGFDRPPDLLQRRFIDPDPAAVLAAAARLEAQGVPAGVAPHSVRAVPLAWLREFAAWPGVVHAHIDEQPAEIAASQAEYRCTPLEVFAKAGLLSPRFTAVHFTHTSETERLLLQQSGGRACLCPTTELDLGDGFFPAEQMPDIPLCIGTDSHAQIDPWAELRAIELHTRARTGRRNVLEPHDTPDALAIRLLSAGAEQGAASLGFDAGKLAAGKLADMIAVDLEEARMVGVRPLPGIVFSGGTVPDGWVGGRRVMQGGRVAGEEGILREGRRVLRAEEQ